MWVLFTDTGIPGWFGSEPVDGAEWVEGVDATFLCRNRRTAKGKWVERGPVPVVEPTEAERVAEREAAYLAALESRDEALREALSREADPVYFRWRRGEAGEAEWLARVAEVKARFPKPDPI